MKVFNFLAIIFELEKRYPIEIYKYYSFKLQIIFVRLFSFRFYRIPDLTLDFHFKMQ